MPDEAKFNCLGFCLASAISSFNDLSPSDGATTIISGVLATCVIPAKSRTVS